MKLNVRHGGFGLALVLTVAAATGCSRSRENPAGPTPELSGAATAAPAPAPTAAPAPAPAPEAPAAPVQPSGPRAELTGEHYALTVDLGAPTAVPGQGTLTVEVRGTDGFHVNELYPTGLELQATNATAPERLQRRDTSQLTQELAQFRVPVQVTGTGATVRGTARFAVCSAENCELKQREFAVALP
jgi:hypothetical protein